MANPSGNGSNGDVGQPGYDGGSSVLEQSVSTDWTPDEQLILEDGLFQYASELSIIRYAKIAVQLQNKTVRDVALRCRWMVKRDIIKRRKDDYLLTRKIKDRKEKMNEHLASTSHLATHNGQSSYSNGVASSGKSNAIQYNLLLSPAGQLIKESAKAMERVSSTDVEIHQITKRSGPSLDPAQIRSLIHLLHENLSLLCQVRKNINDVMSNLIDTPEKPKRMAPLPVQLDEAKLISLLSHPTLQQEMQ